MKIPHRALRFIGLNPTGDLGPLTAYTSRRHGTVWFKKSPPLTPPSLKQLHQRDRFRLAAEAWRNLPHVTQEVWHTACHRAGLYLHGYLLWTFWMLVHDVQKLRTIERQSGLTLVRE